MEKRICLITGGNSGIGKEAAIQLAQLGHRVLIGCRNPSKGALALGEICEKSKTQNVELLTVDMSSQQSIRRMADSFRQSYDKLDVLIHNAADFDISRKKPMFSEENIETIWAANHIGPVLLSDLLIDELKESDQGRIITVASQGLIMHPFLRIRTDDPEFRKGDYSVEKAYYQSKLAQIMYTYWLARIFTGTKITVNCIRVTNVKIDLHRYPNLSGFMKFMYSIKSKFSISPDLMAETYTFLATSPELSSVSGRYFNKKNQVVSSSRYSRDFSNIDKLMELTMRYIR